MKSYTNNRKRLSVPCYFLAPCDKRKHTAHAHQQAANQASTDSAWRHPVWYVFKTCQLHSERYEISRHQHVHVRRGHRRVLGFRVQISRRLRHVTALYAARAAIAVRNQRTHD